MKNSVVVQILREIADLLEFDRFQLIWQVDY